AIEFIDNYDSRRLECQLQPGVISCLEHVKHMGICQSVLSASHQEVLEEMIDYFDLRKYFYHINGLKNHYAGGKIETAQELIKKIDIPPERILLIGDTTHDYEVSNILNCDCLLVSNGHHPFEKLTNCSVQVISTLIELNNH
ncbi:HAD family hydrolase, partial [Bacteroidota bacterium]